MPRSKGRTGRPWRRIRRQVLARREPCWICGRDIDLTLPQKHRWSATVDHMLPLSKGGDPRHPDNLAAAHMACNSKRGNRIDRPRLVTSRPW
ncbi:MAG: HNH endonuclease [Actinobacteria bacterium]|nr:HNH endonuclease [Actinomycetota bacterium]